MTFPMFLCIKMKGDIEFLQNWKILDLGVEKN